MSNEKDWIPAKDTDFDNFQKKYTDEITPNVGPGGPWDIPSGPFDALLIDKVIWDGKWAVAKNKDDRTPAQARAKTAARVVYEAHLRDFNKEHVKNNTNIPNEDKITMGVPIDDTEPTPVPVPETNPVGEIDKQDVGRHKIFYRNEGGSPGRGKPHGVDFCEIRYQVSETEPVDSKDYPHTVISKRSGKLIVFDGEDSGKKVYYIIRWVNTRGEGGPWSPPFDGIIT